MKSFPKYNAEMSIVELTVIYNTLPGVTQIKKFSDKKQAITRLDKLAAEFTPKAAKEVTKRGNGVGTKICAMLQNGDAVDDIIKTIMEQFPQMAAGRDAKTARSHIGWYRSKMKTAAAK